MLTEPPQGSSLAKLKPCSNPGRHSPSHKLMCQMGLLQLLKSSFPLSCMWAETPNPYDIFIKLPLSCRALSIQNIELKFYFDVPSVPGVSFLQGRRWLHKAIEKQTRVGCFPFQKKDLSQRLLKHLSSPPSLLFPPPDLLHG